MKCFILDSQLVENIAALSRKINRKKNKIVREKSLSNHKMKLQVFLLTCAALMGLSMSANVTWGIVGDYDVLLHYEIVKKSSSFMQVGTFDATYPQPQEFNNKTITAIQVIDQMPGSKGGYAQMYAGGVGFNHVTIHFKSQRGKGFNFILKVFGAR